MNLLCCLIARKVGHCHTIARVRNPIYSNELTFIKQQLGISMIINPDRGFHSASRQRSKIDQHLQGKVELLKLKVKTGNESDIDSQFRLSDRRCSAMSSLCRDMVSIIPRIFTSRQTRR